MQQGELVRGEWVHRHKLGCVFVGTQADVIADKAELVVISIKDNLEENQLYTEDDFLGG